MRRIWKWLTAPGEGNVWRVVACLMFVFGVAKLLLGIGEPVADFAYALAALLAARVTFLESIALDRDTLLLKLLKESVERKREQRETN